MAPDVVFVVRAFEIASTVASAVASAAITVSSIRSTAPASVPVASEKELVPTLEIIKAAVLAGELDTAIDAASNKLRAGFQR